MPEVRTREGPVDLATTASAGQDRSPRLRRDPAGALAQDLVHQPLERLNKEIKRRSRVVGTFPNEAAVIRLIGAVLADTHDECATDERRYLSEESMAKMVTTDHDGHVALTGLTGQHRDDLKAHHSAGGWPLHAAVTACGMQWILLVGVLLEGLGIFLGWQELRVRKAQVEAFEAEPEPTMPVANTLRLGSPRYPELSAAGMTVEERLHRLEQAVSRLPQDLDTLKREAVTEAADRAERYASNLGALQRKKSLQTTRLLLGTLTDTQRPKWALVCLFGGLALQAMSAFLQSTC